MLNLKIAENEALLDVLSSVFDQPTTKVAAALKKCNIVSWEDLMSSVRKDASKLMSALQHEKTPRRKATPIASQKVTGSYGPSDTRFND